MWNQGGKKEMSVEKEAFRDIYKIKGRGKDKRGGEYDQITLDSSMEI
jgi:hypothetical protein